ncbi:MAG: LacI family DNA-binding transcriptional regulator [Candidatus Didemnitutus sp.]|nr:LacI family DNA-binding transcriptional regulator [Candidatus Didemnitutus sp.]
MARAAGVSLATASLALRGSPLIAEETRASVRASAEKLGYHVNPLISELMGSLRHRRRRQQVTMAEIAARAGVSRAKVSLVLRHPARGSPALAARVSAAITQLGYARDPLHAALLSFRRSNATRPKHTTIAFLTVTAPNATWRNFLSHQQMFEGAAARAAEIGYSLEEFSVTPGMSPRRLKSILLARGIHAIIVAPVPDGCGPADFDFTDFSSVGLGFSFGWPPVERVSNDHFQSIVLAMRECRVLGYRRIGLIVSRAVSERLGNRWLAGYLLSQAGYPTRERLQPLMPDTAAGITRALPGWLARQKPDVLIYGNHEIGESLAHLVGPKIGLVNLHVRSADGAESGIYQASAEVGARAIDAVVSQLHHNIVGLVPNPSQHLIPGRWVAGHTTPGPGRLRP